MDSIPVERIKYLALLTETDPFQRIVKAQEELGEMSAALLARHKTLNRSASAKDNILEEGIDTLLCVLDVIYAEGYSTDDIVTELDRKCTKWESKVKGRMAAGE